MSLYTRMRTVASKSWGCSPFEIERLGKEGSILMSDVLSLIKLSVSDPWQGVGIVEFVFPGAIEKVQKKKREAENRKKNLGTMRFMVNALKAKNPTDERTLAWIKAAEEELKRNGS